MSLTAGGCPKRAPCIGKSRETKTAENPWWETIGNARKIADIMMVEHTLMGEDTCHDRCAAAIGRTSEQHNFNVENALRDWLESMRPLGLCEARGGEDDSQTIDQNRRPRVQGCVVHSLQHPSVEQIL